MMMQIYFNLKKW